jgi:hypothetical protein
MEEASQWYVLPIVLLHEFALLLHLLPSAPLCKKANSRRAKTWSVSSLLYTLPLLCLQHNDSHTAGTQRALDESRNH